MSDAFSTPYASPPVRRRWPLALAVLIAFAAGLAVAWWGINRWTPQQRQTVAVPAIVVRPVAVRAPVAIAPSPIVDPAALAARTELVAGRLTEIETRTSAVAAEADAASGRAGRAEAMLLAAAARRAVERGTGLGGLEDALRERFGAIRPRAVQVVVQAARAPVTLESLRTGLDSLGDVLIAGGGDWWQQARAQLAMLVVIHRADTPSPLPAERLAQARRLLSAGAIEPALAEVANLPGAAAAGDWIAAARRYAEAQRALDALDVAAIRGEATTVATTPPVSR